MYCHKDGWPTVASQSATVPKGTVMEKPSTNRAPTVLAAVHFCTVTSIEPINLRHIAAAAASVRITSRPDCLVGTCPTVQGVLATPRLCRATAASMHVNAASTRVTAACSLSDAPGGHLVPMGAEITLAPPRSFGPPSCLHGAHLPWRALHITIYYRDPSDPSRALGAHMEVAPGTENVTTNQGAVVAMLEMLTRRFMGEEAFNRIYPNPGDFKVDWGT
ncbi:hypothetical protein C8J57DRAFT_1231158 [Mycena rebaudengoi]|nr:hypothetical protein C8J57DRAFT_1231158 [Mycena rebaudengoi]